MLCPGCGEKGRVLREKEYPGFVTRHIGTSWERRCVLRFHKNGDVSVDLIVGERTAKPDPESEPGSVELVDAPDLPLFSR